MAEQAPVPPHRRANLPQLVERWLPEEVGGTGFPAILIRGGVIVMKDPPNRPAEMRQPGGVCVGVGGGGAWKFESSPEAATEEPYWRPLEVLVAILRRQITGEREPWEALRDLWEHEQRHREQSAPRQLRRPRPRALSPV